MEGRDTGSPGYDRAAAYVAGRFERAGLRPAGDGGTFFQRIRFDEIEVTSEGTGSPLRLQTAVRARFASCMTSRWRRHGTCPGASMRAATGSCAAIGHDGRTRCRRRLLRHAPNRADAGRGAARSRHRGRAVALLRVDDMGFTLSRRVGRWLTREQS
jgi:hypothetical protein